MAGNDEQFNVWLKTHFDGDALAAARRSFDQTKKSAKETDDTLGDLGLTAGNLKSTLLSFVAVDAVWTQFKEGFEQVAALEQAMNQLERATKRNGDNFDVVRGKIVGMAESLKKAAGVDDDAAIRGMVDLYNATGDVANATQLARLAADVFTSGTLPTYEAALQAVTSAAQGKTRALVQLKLAKDDDTAATLTAQQALDRIEEAFGGATANASGLRVEVNRLSESWEDLRNDLVEKLTPGLGVAIKTVQSFFAILDGLWAGVGEIFVRTGSWLGSVVTALGRVWQGDFGGAKAALKSANTEVSGMFDYLVAQAETSAAKVKGIWSGLTDKPNVDATPARAIGGGGPGGGPDGPRELSPEALAEMWNLEQISKARAAAIAKREAENKRFLERNKALQEKAADVEKKAIADTTKTLEQAMHERSRMILEEVQLRKKAEEAKREAAQAAASATVGAAIAVFGESKALASADAAISTWAGAARALKDWPAPYSYVIAAATIAAGLARVAQINSTQPDTTRGAGFDVPMYDAAAVAGGRRWALDMVGSFSSGARAGWAEGMGSFGGGRGGMTDNSKTYNFNFYGGGFADPAIMSDAKKLKRRIDVVDRTIDSQRTVARNRRS